MGMRCDMKGSKPHWQHNRVLGKDKLISICGIKRKQSKVWNPGGHCSMKWTVRCMVINLEKRQFLRFGTPHNWTKYRKIMQHHLPHLNKLSKKWHDQRFCPIVLVKCLENECKYCRCRLILSLYLNIIFQTSASFEVHA